MDATIPEASYPLGFRSDEAKRLGGYLRQRQSVNLIGMKRVGISNFLRFFLHHKDIGKTYISHEQRHLFIPVDLNDLVEREIYPFWTLTLKRIVDASEVSTLSSEIKKKINSLFLTSIQTQDLFLITDNIRKAISYIVVSNLLPTLFFLRFDRLQDVFTSSFFDNLEGLRDGVHYRLAYVFTSYRGLDSLFPQAKTALSVDSQTLFVKPAKAADLHTIYKSFLKRYDFLPSSELDEVVPAIAGGHFQYLQVAVVVLKEANIKKPKETDILDLLLKDERMTLLSEEVWSSLTSDEKKVLTKVSRGESILDRERENCIYLWETGLITGEAGKEKIFSPILTDYVLNRDQENQKKTSPVHMTRKEHLLYKLLESQPDEICEREKIIETVWPESAELGISDWAIDRLVARVRSKLKEQQSKYEIVTIRTRGYKLSTMKE